MSEPTPATPEYGASSIQVLEGMEAVRKRPGMYIGDPSGAGLYQLIWESVDNAIDEALAGHCDTVDVIIHPDNSISIGDNGRGIPVEMHPAEGKPTVEVVMTVLHAGGKFDNNAYKVSGGLHGVGVSCVNAVSRWMKVRVRRDGTEHEIAFERGETTEPLRELGPTTDRGTTVHFKPDTEVFGDNTIFDAAIVRQRLRELSFLNRGVRIQFEDLREGGSSEVFLHDDGLAGFVAWLNQGKDTLGKDVIHLERECGEGISVEVAMQYHDGYDENVHCFANNIRNRDGGTHLSGFRASLTRVLNSYAKSNDLIKGKNAKPPTGDDLREGLTAIVSVKLPGPKFSSQTKDRLINNEIEGLVQTHFGQAFTEWLEENPRVAKDFGQ